MQPGRPRIIPRFFLPALGIAAFGVLLVTLLQNHLALQGFVRGEPQLVSSIDLLWLTGVGVTWLIPLAATPVLLLIVYHVWMFFLHTRTATPGDSASLTTDPQALAAALANGTPTSDQVDFFRDMIVDPASWFLRISESIEPYTRSTAVRTTYSVRVPGTQNTLTIPLHMSRRGHLESGLRITAGPDERVTSLTHVESAAFSIAVVGALVDRAGVTAARKFRSRTPSLESRVSEVMTSSESWGGLNEVGQNQRFGVVVAICSEITGLKKRSDESLNEAAAMVMALYRNHPICVRKSPSATGVVARFTVERRVLVPMLARVSWRLIFKELLQPASLAPPGLVRYRLLVNALLLLETFAFRASRFVTRLVRKASDALRVLLGVGSSVIAYPLTSATRTSSYHLELRGPEKTYLGQQFFESGDGVPVAADELSLMEMMTEQPFGQRHSHIYIRNADEAVAGYRYVSTFFERTPGSMAVAAVTAFSAFVVTLILALQGMTKSLVNYDPSGLLQILLAFPFAVAAASSVTGNRTIWGGVIASRVWMSITVLSTLAALLVSTLPRRFFPFPVDMAWVVILAVLAANLVATAGSWFARVRVETHFISRQQGSDQ